MKVELKPWQKEIMKSVKKQTKFRVIARPRSPAGKSLNITQCDNCFLVFHREKTHCPSCGKLNHKVKK